MHREAQNGERRQCQRHEHRAEDHQRLHEIAFGASDDLLHLPRGLDVVHPVQRVEEAEDERHETGDEVEGSSYHERQGRAAVGEQWQEHDRSTNRLLRFHSHTPWVECISTMPEHYNYNNN